MRTAELIRRSYSNEPSAVSARGACRDRCRSTTARGGRTTAAASAVDEKGDGRGCGHPTDSKQGEIVFALCPMHACRKSRFERALTCKGGAGNNNGTG